MPLLEVGRGGAAHERRQQVTDGPLRVERGEARRSLRGEQSHKVRVRVRVRVRVGVGVGVGRKGYGRVRVRVSRLRGE